MILLLLACPPSVEPAPEPTPALKTLTEGTEIELAEGSFSGATELYSGAPAALWSASGERVVLYSLSDATPAMPIGGMLLSTDGEQIATLPTPHSISWELGTAVAQPADRSLPVLIRLEDGATLTPELTLPDGSSAAEVRVFLSESILVAARGESGEAYYGIFTDTGEPALSPIGLWPIGMSAEGSRIEAWSGRGVPGSDGTCVRYQLDGTPRCRMVDGGAAMDSWPLSAGWTAVSSWTEGVQLYRDSQPIPWRLEEDCRWTVSATLSEPPRVLAECHPDRSSAERLRRLWAPDWERSWTQQLPPSHRGSFLTRPAHYSILAEPIPDVTPTLAEHWIDLESGERWRAPLLSPLTYDGLPRPGLGRDPHTGSLTLLDFDSGAYHPIAGAGEDCPAELKELGREHGLVLLTCRSRPNPSLFRFVHHWSMVIDLETKTSWRIDQFPEAVLSSDAILVSDRTQTQAEGHVGFERLSRLQLR